MSNEAETGREEHQESPQDAIYIGEFGSQLPIVEVLTGRGVILGKSGSGKSNSASVVIEELLEKGFPTLIVDVDGEYFGLKEEYEILHLGADEECDLQVGAEHAKKIAELTLEQNIPVILDVSGYLHEEESRELIKEVGRHLFAKEKKLKKPFLMLVEEVHEFIPESGLDDAGRMLVKIAKRGRKHGLGLCGVSQRPADVKKDFITQCDWLVWHRLTWDNDTSVVRRVLGSEYADKVQDLNDGEAFVMTDWNDEIRRVQFRRKHTFDAGATPGLEEIERPDLKSVSENIISELEDISEHRKAESNEVQRLESELEDREERIDQLEEKLEKTRDVNELAERFTDALAQAGGSENIQTTVEEIQEEKNSRIRSLEDENQRLREENNRLRERVEDLEEYAEASDYLKDLAENADEASEAYVRLGEALGLDPEPDETEKLRNRIKSLQEKIDILENQREANPEDGIGVHPDYSEFVEDDVVQTAIQDAKQEASSPRYVKGVIKAVMATGGPVTYSEIADELGISSKGHVATAVNALHDRQVVTKSQKGRVTKVDLNVDELQELHAVAHRQAESEELISKI